MSTRAKVALLASISAIIGMLAFGESTLVFIVLAYVLWMFVRDWRGRHGYNR